MNHGFVDEPARRSWQLALQEMPEEWASRWRSSRSSGSAAAVVSLIGKVIGEVEEAHLSLDDAGRILRALYADPLALHHDGAELMAIAIASDMLRSPTTAEDRAASWTEVLDCYRRIVLNATRESAA